MYTASIKIIISKYLRLMKEKTASSVRSELSRQDFLFLINNLLAELGHCPTANPQLLLLQNRVRYFSQNQGLSATDLGQKLAEELQLALSTL